MGKLTDTVWSMIVAALVFGSIWAIAGLPAAWWFSVGFIVASVSIAYEIGSRKARTQNTPDSQRGGA